MSVVPTSTLPKCTRTVVMDMLFLRKYKLSYSQMMVLYYLLLLKNWVTFSEDNHYVIMSTKIEKDLKLHPKTIEASITKLKKLELISIKRVKVKEWNSQKTYRAIGITSLGKEFNLSHYKENQYQHSVELEKENEEFRVENDNVHSQNMKLESENQDLELKNQILNITLEKDEEINRASIEALTNMQELEEKLLELEKENQALKEKIEIQENQNSTPKEETEKNINIFRKKIIRQYAQSGKAICNAVKNQDSWLTETNFHINSYSRLSIYLPSGELKQIAEPKKIDNFWKWLFYHQKRIGKLLDTNQKADISTLHKYQGETINLNNKPYKIHKLTPVIAGVKVTISDKNGNLTRLGNSYGSEVIDVEKCREFFELNRV
jgi:DNA-binding MarR family transcriptional regulator